MARCIDVRRHHLECTFIHEQQFGGVERAGTVAEPERIEDDLALALFLLDWIDPHRADDFDVHHPWQNQ